MRGILSFERERERERERESMVQKLLIQFEVLWKDELGCCESATIGLEQTALKYEEKQSLRCWLHY
jgi:hypothetical protein